MASRKLDEVDESGVDRRYKLHAPPPPCPSSEHSQAQNNVFCAPKLLCFFACGASPHSCASGLGHHTLRAHPHCHVCSHAAITMAQSSERRRSSGSKSATWMAHFFCASQAVRCPTLLPTPVLLLWHACIISTPSVGPPHVDLRALSSRYHSGVMWERARVDACMHVCMHAWALCFVVNASTLFCELRFFLLVAN
jgi:hypothetical protein